MPDPTSLPSDDLRVVVVTREERGFTRDVYGYFNSYGAAREWAEKNIPQRSGVDYQPVTVVTEQAKREESPLCATCNDKHMISQRGIVSAWVRCPDCVAEDGSWLGRDGKRYRDGGRHG